MARRVSTDDLLDAGGVAEVLGLSNPNAVSVYRARYQDFPEPAWEGGRCVLWVRSDIEAWAKDDRHPRRHREQ